MLFHYNFLLTLHHEITLHYIKLSIGKNKAANLFLVLLTSMIFYYPTHSVYAVYSHEICLLHIFSTCHSGVYVSISSSMSLINNSFHCFYTYPNQQCVMETSLSSLNARIQNAILELYL